LRAETSKGARLKAERAELQQQLRQLVRIGPEELERIAVTGQAMGVSLRQAEELLGTLLPADRLLTADADFVEGAYYLSGNVVDGRPEGVRVIGIGNKAQTDLPQKAFRSKPWPGAPKTVLKADEALRQVLAEVGCVRPKRDEHDAQIVDKVRQRAGLPAK